MTSPAAQIGSNRGGEQVYNLYISLELQFALVCDLQDGLELAFNSAQWEIEPWQILFFNLRQPEINEIKPFSPLNKTPHRVYVHNEVHRIDADLPDSVSVQPVP
jgi:hypothetical protein